jgi:hypothetical protein
MPWSSEDRGHQRPPLVLECARVRKACCRKAGGRSRADVMEQCRAVLVQDLARVTGVVIDPGNEPPAVRPPRLTTESNRFTEVEPEPAVTYKASSSSPRTRGCVVPTGAGAFRPRWARRSWAPVVPAHAGAVLIIPTGEDADTAVPRSIALPLQPDHRVDRQVSDAADERPQPFPCSGSPVGVPLSKQQCSGNAAT